jgi:tyrosine-specific transport protein
LWRQAQNQGEMVTQLLVESTQSTSIVHITQGFAFFAIATSFLPVSFSFVDFLTDGFILYKRIPSRHALAALALLPPLIIALIDPRIFLEALNFAGGICAVLLFGLLPALMALLKHRAKWSFASVGVLLFLILGSLAMASVQLLHELGIL